MIGNDVVDLGDPEAQPEAIHPRFDERVFAPRESEVLSASGAPHRLRWILWAAKEAAYKVVRKLDAHAVFSPRRFVVELDSRLEGRVRHAAREGDPQRVLPVHVEEDRLRVHAVAASAPLWGRSLRQGVAWLPGDLADARTAARAVALLRVAECLGAAPESLRIEQEGRVPVVWCKGERAPVDLSLSHHGRFVAFALELLPPAGEGRP